MADPGFPREGGANSPGGANIRFCHIFPKKLHEIERIHAFLVSPLRSTTVFSGGSKGVGAPGVHTPCRPICSQFHVVFLENLAKSYVGAPLKGCHSLLLEILDHPWSLMITRHILRSHFVLFLQRFIVLNKTLTGTNTKVLFCFSPFISVYTH